MAPSASTVDNGSIKRWSQVTTKILVTLAVFYVILIQAFTPEWKHHLQVDPAVFESRAITFFSSGWAQLQVNEYQPGALWFFVVVKWLAGPLSNFNDYLLALAVSNLALLAIMLIFVDEKMKPRSFWTLLALIMFTGPILVFRFEVLVVLMVLASWRLWIRQDLEGSAVLLGLATATKIYPLIILPLLLRSAYVESGMSQVIRVGTSYALGLMMMIGTWALFGGTWASAWSAMHYHLDKPFGIDGLWGGVIPLIQKVAGVELIMNPRNGVHGFDPSIGEYLSVAFSWLWVPVLVLYTICLWHPKRGDSCPSALLLFSYIGAFVVLSKVSNPQYMWWSVAFLPFVSNAEMSSRKMYATMVIVTLSLVLSQVVYPLNYSLLIESLPSFWFESWVFWLNIAKNALFAMAVVWSAILLRQLRPGHSAQRLG